MTEDKPTVDFLLQQLLEFARVQQRMLDAQDRKLDLMDERLRRVELDLAELKGRIIEMSARMPVLIGTYQPPARPAPGE